MEFMKDSHDNCTVYMLKISALPAVLSFVAIKPGKQIKGAPQGIFKRIEPDGLIMNGVNFGRFMVTCTHR